MWSTRDRADTEMNPDNTDFAAMLKAMRLAGMASRKIAAAVAATRRPRCHYGDVVKCGWRDQRVKPDEERDEDELFAEADVTRRSAGPVCRRLKPSSAGGRHRLPKSRRHELDCRALRETGPGVGRARRRVSAILAPALPHGRPKQPRAISHSIRFARRARRSSVRSRPRHPIRRTLATNICWCKRSRSSPVPGSIRGPATLLR